MIIDAQGNPQNPRVVRGLGVGLDEKALEAVRKYRFKPAMKGNTPVAMQPTSWSFFACSEEIDRSFHFVGGTNALRKWSIWKS